MAKKVKILGSERYLNIELPDKASLASEIRIEVITDKKYQPGIKHFIGVHDEKRPYASIAFQKKVKRATRVEITIKCVEGGISSILVEFDSRGWHLVEN